MSATDIRLDYQKETGLALDEINAIATVDYSPCDEDDAIAMRNYIKWLERKLDEAHEENPLLRVFEYQAFKMTERWWKNFNKDMMEMFDKNVKLLGRGDEKEEK